MRIISAPMFCVIENNVSFSINEYTLRGIQVDIAKGLIPSDRYYIYQENSNIYFNKQGKLSHLPIGLDLADQLAIELHIVK